MITAVVLVSAPNSRTSNLSNAFFFIPVSLLMFSMQFRNLRRAISDYLRHERAYVAEAGRELTEAGPFRKTAE